MKHYTEEELESFILHPEQWNGEQKRAVEEFLRHNALAREYVLAVTKYRNEVQQRLSEPPSKEDERIAEKALRPTKSLYTLPGTGQKDLFWSKGEQQWVSVYQWGRLIRRHPTRTVAMVSMIAAMLAIMVLYNRPAADDNPSYAETKENKLIVYNSRGEILFTKSSPGIPLYSAGGEQFNSFTKPFLIADADGDGTNEVVTNLYNRTHGMSSGGLICYDMNGKELWKYTAAVDLSRIDGGRRRATRGEVFDYVMFRNEQEHRTRLFVVIADPTFSASSVVEVNPWTGEHLQQYWHTGGVNKIIQCDVNRDGRSELLVSGINDHIEAVFAAGLDPDALNGGSSVAYPGFHQGERAQELFYMIFPPTRFYSNLAFVKFNTLWSLRKIELNDHSFEVQTNETPPRISTDVGGGVHYIINDKLEVSSIGISSFFEKIYNDYRVNVDSTLPRLEQQYLDHLRSNVRWWDGSAFVGRARYNAKYTAH